MDAAWYGSADRAYYQTQAGLRAANIRGASGTGRYLVAGHGYGHLVQSLRTAGNTETWGCDLSSYAVDQSRLAYPAIAARFVSGDCRVNASMASVRSNTIGGRSNVLYNVIITEDLLSACGPNKHPLTYTAQDWTDADAEVQSTLTALRSVLASNGRMIHIISMLEPGFIDLINVTPGLWYTGEQWRSRIPATDVVLRLSDLVVF